MRIRVVGGVVAVWLLVAASGPSREERPPVKADALHDLKQLQGTWQLDSFDNGKKKSKAALKKRTLFVGGDLFLVRDGDKIVQIGTLRLMPARSPRLIDAVVRKGEHEDGTMLGIYELKGDTLRLCFDPEGDSRPKKFEPKSDTPVFVATYKRVQPSAVSVDIVGKYRSESVGLEGKRQEMSAEVEKRGDAYLVKWTVPGGVAYVGTGIRQGDTFSVAWANRGTVGISVYRIEKGPKLVGVFTEVGGAGLVTTETLTSTGKGGWVEVRLRGPAR